MSGHPSTPAPQGDPDLPEDHGRSPLTTVDRPGGHSPRVQVYRNLTRSCWSVRVGGRVIAHPREVTLGDARMRVQPAGRERVRRTGRKTVHAYVSGTLQDAPGTGTADGRWRRARYNPHDTDTFECAGVPVRRAARAHLDAGGRVWLLDPA